MFRNLQKHFLARNSLSLAGSLGDVLVQSRQISPKAGPSGIRQRNSNGICSSRQVKPPRANSGLNLLPTRVCDAQCGRETSEGIFETRIHDSQSLEGGEKIVA